MLPIVFVGPIAGVFVDRWPLKPTLITSDLLRAGLALLLIPAAIGLAGLWRAGGAQLRVGVLRPGADGDDPHRTCRSTGLLSANALMQIAFMGSRIVGPATAGALVAAFTPQVCYAIDVAQLPRVRQPDRLGRHRPRRRRRRRPARPRNQHPCRSGST